MTSRNDARWTVRVLTPALALIGSIGAAAVDTSTPEATVRSLHEGLVTVAAAHRDADLDTRYRELEPLITATHDLPYIAEFAIRRQWRDLSADERQLFVAAFTRLSVMTYASRFAGVGEASFTLEESSEPDSGRAEVRASIARADGSAVPLAYLLQQGEQGWKIINIIADGVSDLALKRAEYQRVLGSGSIEDLIRHVEEQTALLR